MASLPNTVETTCTTNSHLPSLNNSAVTNNHDYHQTMFPSPSFMHTDFEANLQSTGFSMGSNVQRKWGALSAHCAQFDNLPSYPLLKTLGLENSAIPPTYGKLGNSQWFQDTPIGSWNSNLLACNNRVNRPPFSPFAIGYDSDNVSLAQMMTDHFGNVMTHGETSPINGIMNTLPLNQKDVSFDAETLGCNARLDVDSSKGKIAIRDAGPYAGQPTLSTVPSETMITNGVEYSSVTRHTMVHQSAAMLRVANQDGQNLDIATKASATQPSLLGICTHPSSTANSPIGLKAVFSSVISRSPDCQTSPKCTTGTAKEESHKTISRKKPPSLPTLVEIEGSEGAGRPCNSSDESDDSLGVEVSSDCNQRDGVELATSHSKLSHKKKRLKSTSENNIVPVSIVKDLDCAKFKEKYHKFEEDSTEDVSSKKVDSNDSDDSSHQPANETSKPTETPKSDFIHVRARRGQATDSHSLAERIRREKISERMKFLQDLVPGCSKITGKAVMLDEIINYVQSLQRQVEFLSMKLAAVNPRVDFNMDSLFRKEILHSQVSLQQPLMFSAEKLPPYTVLNRQSSHAFQATRDHGDIARSLLDVHPLGGPDPAFLGAIPASTPSISKEPLPSNVLQTSQAWDDELQILVQTSYAQGKQTCLTSAQGEQASKLDP